MAELDDIAAIAHITKQVDRWQRCPFVHPLTCARCPGLMKLAAVAPDELILECRDCQWTQYVPENSSLWQVLWHFKDPFPNFYRWDHAWFRRLCGWWSSIVKRFR